MNEPVNFCLLCTGHRAMSAAELGAHLAVRHRDIWLDMEPVRLADGRDERYDISDGAA